MASAASTAISIRPLNAQSEAHIGEPAFAPIQATIAAIEWKSGP